MQLKIISADLIVYTHSKINGILVNIYWIMLIMLTRAGRNRVMLPEEVLDAEK